MAKVKKIRKWDEVTGNAVEEQIPESIDPIEDVGAGPSISRNHMRGIEDMVEQNDNSFDGIINNGEKGKEQQPSKASLLDKLHKKKQEAEETKQDRPKPERNHSQDRDLN